MEKGNDRRGDGGRKLGRGTKATSSLENRSVGSCCNLVFTLIVFQGIQKYYGLGILRNVGNVDAMVATTKPILFHSTDPYSDKYKAKAESFSTNMHDKGA